MKRTLGIIAALLVAVSGALWLLRGGLPDTAMPTVAERAPPARETGPTVTATPASPSETSRATNPAPTPVSSEQRMEELADLMAQQVYEGAGRRFVDHLTSQGLAHSDSERIVAKLMHEAAVCRFDAYREQAITQGIAFDALLDALGAEFYDADGPAVAALVDMQAVARRELPCVLAALEQAGIPPSTSRRLLQ